MKWLISANSNIYDHFQAFYDNDVIDWRMNNTKYKVEDIVYIYSTKPYQKIMFKCIIEKIDIPFDDMRTDWEYWKEEQKNRKANTFARFKLIRTFDNDKLSLKVLQMNGLKSAPQGPMKINKIDKLDNYISNIEEKCNIYNFEDETPPILFCNVTPMKLYQGPEETSSVHGGKYVKEHGIGYELFNFKEINEKYYGFVQPPTGNRSKNLKKPIDKFKQAKIRIERLESKSHKDFVNGITIIWVSTDDNKGRVITGWYKNARVYRKQQTLNNEKRRFINDRGEGEEASYYIECHVDDATLLPEKERTFNCNMMGQSNIWYGNPNYNRKVTNYINQYNGTSLYDKEGLKERIEKDVQNVPNKYKETLLKARIGQSKYRNLILDKFNNKCVLCGVGGSEFLIASHIKAWKDCENGEHLDEHNGLLLCPNHDKLFDNHYISFDENGKILISEDLSRKNRTFLNLNENMKIKISDDSQKYFSYHRKLFEKLI
ncbi:MAG: HNH endonuclease [Candidatus Izimaplasma sp.]|nr:HNH endonuclease [Candidatus Izimaplasma bacterium]